MNLIPDLSYGEVMLTLLYVSLLFFGRFLDRAYGEIRKIKVIMMEIRDNLEPEKPADKESPI